MFIAKLKIVGALCLTALVSGAIWSRATLESVSRADGAQVEAESLGSRFNDDLIGIPGSRDGIIKYIGVEIKPGEKTPQTRQFSMMVDNQLRNYRELRIGDVVEKGQSIAQIDDAIARADMRIAMHKLKAAQADKASSEKTRDEANARWKTRKGDFGKSATSFDDVRTAELTYNRYVSELDAKEQAVRVAQAELDKAKAVLDSYQIRSGVRGTIRKIHKHPGEAVHALESVVTLELIEDKEK